LPGVPATDAAVSHIIDGTATKGVCHRLRNRPARRIHTLRQGRIQRALDIDADGRTFPGAGAAWSAGRRSAHVFRHRPQSPRDTAGGHRGPVRHTNS